jgi:hypothetical protein
MGDVAAWAQAYADRGWSPVPLEPGQKWPALSGWQHLRLGNADLAGYFSGGQNIGLLLGETSGGLIDVDLDSPRARDLAAEYLPPTGLISGRRSSPRSHWWYKVTEPIETVQLRGLEVRSTGVQTVVPPSKHPSGEDYVWHAFDRPAELSANELIAAVYDLAQAALPKVWSSRPVVPVNKKTPDPMPPFLLGLKDLNHFLQRRIRAILDERGLRRPSIQGDWGSKALTAAAVVITRGFALDLEAALIFLRSWSDKYADPLWDDGEILRRIEYATDQGDMPWAYFLIHTDFPDSLSARAVELRRWASAQHQPPPATPPSPHRPVPVLAT